MLSIYLAILAFIFGIVFLYKGSDILIDGTVKTAAQIGVSTLIISVILVGFGTSAPEFAISVGAAVQKHADISLGNIIGSCIANFLLVLGISAIIKPIDVKNSIMKREMPIALGAVIILLISSYFGFLDSLHIYGGLFFLIAFVIFIFFFIKCAQSERVKFNIKKDGSITKNLFMIILGIAGVVLGAYLLIESSITIAVYLGIPQLVIALSLVAVGTSLPELIVSAMASYRGEADIAIGNVLGSNVFNILLILGVSALFIPLNAILSFNIILILFVVNLIMFPVLFTKYKISRIEGVILLIIYSIFIWYIYF